MENEAYNAILIDPRDSVVTLTCPVRAGERIRWAAAGESACLTAAEDIPRWHKATVRPIAAGENVLKYGEYIGRATRDIAPGEWVHTHNLG